MPSHHSSGHHSSSSHHSSSRHSSSSHIHHNTTSNPIHHSSTFVGGRATGGGCVRTIVAMLVIIVVIAGIGMFAVFKLGSNAASTLISSNINTSGSTDLSQDPSVISDLKIMHASLDSRIADWQTQNDKIVHHMPTSDAGLPNNFNTKEVVYGHCSTSQFYMFVLNVTRPENTVADTEGYEYVPGSTPTNCAPTGWHIMTSETAAPDWYFVTLDSTLATTTPPTAQPASAG